MSIIKRKDFALLVIIILISYSIVFSQEKPKLTIEKLFSDEIGEITSVPFYAWLQDGQVLIYDTQKPKNERTFCKFDPSKGTKVTVLDAAKALKSLHQLLGKKIPSRLLSYPYEIESFGKYAIYRIGSDLFLLDMAAASFTRLTKTYEEPLNYYHDKWAKFSPDGKKILFTLNNDLFLYDIASRAEKQITTDGTESMMNGKLSWMYWEDIFRRGAGMWWAPDSQAIAYLQTDESMCSIMSYIDFKPFVPRIIKQRFPTAGGVNPKVRLGIIELKTGNTTWMNLSTEHYEYIFHVDWLPDSEHVSVQTMNRDQDELDLYFVDRLTGTVKNILKETDEGWVNLHDDIYFLKNSDHFIWGSERDGYRHLYLYKMDGTLINQITKGNWAVRGPKTIGYWWGHSVVGIDEPEQALYFTSLEKSSIERHLYKIRFDGSQKQRISKEDGFHNVDMSPDCTYYIDNYSTASKLPSISIHQNTGKKTDVIQPSKSELLDMYDVQFPEFLSVPAEDGFPMPAQITKPKDFDPSKKYPVIIFHYGGPQAPTVINHWQRYTLFNQILLSKGFLCFSVDNRSATAISKKLENTILNQMAGENELNDLVAAVKWLKGQPYVDPSRIGMWGGSYGGSFTLLAMTRSKEFKAGIAKAPVTDQRYHEPRWTEFSMKLPEANREAYERVSLVNHAKNLHGRLLLIHGTFDDNVHIQNTWAFVEELIQAGKKFEMMIYPMRKHGWVDKPGLLHYFHTMVDFWCKNL
jgi:dipeptidyl-peptidase-4